MLGRHDIVFGPAQDGGFWLVGARRSPRLPALFGQVRWSSPDALSDTLGNLEGRVLVGFAATLDDVDDGAAYRSWRRGISSTKLHGRKRLSSWWTRIPSQASRHAEGEPGSAKR